MKSFLAISLLLLAGCVSVPEPSNAERLCVGIEKLGGTRAECVRYIETNAVPEPTPRQTTSQTSSVTCHTTRDFPGMSLNKSTTTVCE